MKHKLLGLFFVTMIVGVKSHIDQKNKTSDRLAEPQTMFGRIEGDFIIGALFPVHQRPMITGEGKPLLCGMIREMYGIQRVEAALYAVDLINKNENILPGVKLGIEIRDECWSAPVALHQTLKLMYESISRQSPCDYTNSCDRKIAPLIGVLGPAASSITAQVHNLLQLFNIPQIGYSSTSVEFSDKNRYGYFMRVVPADRYQAQVIVDILKNYNWTYVSAVYTDDNYGRSGIKIFKDLAQQANLCIAKEDGMLSNTNQARFDEVIDKFVSDKHVNVIVCFCEGLTVRGLLSSIKWKNLTDRFLFIGTDGWAGREDVVSGLEECSQGNLMIRIHSPRVEEFDDYYIQLDPRKNHRNPWFDEFWESHFNCSLHYNRNRQYSRCTGKEKLTVDYTQDPKLSLVIKAVYTFAHGLHKMRSDLCQNVTAPCDMLPFNGTHFLEYLKNVSFTYKDEPVNFNAYGDAPARYEILNYQRLDNGKYSYVNIGFWVNNTLSLTRNLQFPSSRKDMVVSMCSLPCHSGFYKDFGDKNTCCWLCVPCAANEISDGNICIECPSTYKPNLNKSECEEIIPDYVKWSDTQALVSVVYSYIGLMFTLIVVCVFFIYRNTPVVKSSTKELSYMMLIGMCLSHCATFVMIGKPTVISCTIRRILPGFSFAMIYASLLTKTNRIARILSGSNKRFPKMHLRYLSTKSQILISSLLIGTEVLICILMIVLEPVDTKLTFVHRNEIIISCNTSTRGVVTPMLFNSLLTIMCTYYAFKTRKLPENFNEAKFIGVSMYTTCITWIAFGLVYTGSSSLKSCIACLCISTNALFILIFMFFPKVYIILFKPEQNNRSSFITTKGLRCHFGYTFTKDRSLCQFCKYRLECTEQEISVFASGMAPSDKIQRQNCSCQTSLELLTTY